MHKTALALTALLFSQSVFSADGIFMHWCHFYGSLTSKKISSDKASAEEACANRGMQAGRSYPLMHRCINMKTGLNRLVYSPLPREQACSKRLALTAAATKALLNLIEEFCAAEKSETLEDCNLKIITTLIQLNRYKEVKNNPDFLPEDGAENNGPF